MSFREPIIFLARVSQYLVFYFGRSVIWANGTMMSLSYFVPQPNYISHSSGMWLTVNPPGASSPYTGTFIGGIILPFTLFNHSTYTVALSQIYCGPWYNVTGQDIGVVYANFSYWQWDRHKPIKSHHIERERVLLGDL